MRRFENIFLACDERNVHGEVIGRALPFAKALARANDAPIAFPDAIDAAPGEHACRSAPSPARKGCVRAGARCVADLTRCVGPDG